MDNIYAQCPQVEAIMVDACVIGQEHNNEFLIINSGGGFNTNDIQLSYDINNVLANAQNNDINIDIGNYVGDPTPCGLTNGNINAYSGCSNLISIGPGFNVPPNSIVVLQASAGSTTNAYNFTNLCGSGQCVYVISSSCIRTAGGFTNSGSGTRETIFQIAGGCNQTIIYDRALLVGGDGAFYIPLSTSYGNNGCVVPPSSPAPNPTIPQFTIDNQYCIGDTPDNLPTTSDNGINGTWNPMSINTSSPGMTNYVFTPTAGQCASPFTLSVTVTANVTPIFSFDVTYCRNETPDNLPGTSDNGITGSWNPPTINTSAPGTTNYTFIPDAGQCATDETVSVMVDDNITPTFSVDDEYCVGDTPDALPSVSDNGVTGTWNTSTINTSAPGSTNYLFTPAAGQCALPFTLTVMVDAVINPVFDIDDDYCVGETPDNLPTMSNNGISGIWAPSSISTSASGTINYIFTPTPSQCATNFTLMVMVTNNVTPTFAPIGPLCENSTPPTLPGMSLNGISGVWSPPSINTSIAGLTNYNFTPATGLCASTVSIPIEITARPRGSLNGNVDICPGQCGNISFALSGGSGTYNLNLQINVGPFNFPFTVPGAMIGGGMQICYNGTNPLPSFILPNTLIIPLNAPSGTFTLTLLSMTDQGGGNCANGIIENATMTVTLSQRPDAFNATLEVCDEDNDGTGTFNLNDANNDITGGSPGTTVTYYQNSGLTMLIANPTAFNATNGTVVYALVEDGSGCLNDSELTLLLEMPEEPNLPTFTVCITNPPLNLPVIINGVTGNWSDAGGHVSGNQFDPAGTMEGNYTITFTPDPGQCFTPANTIVNVTSGGPVPLDGIPSVVCLGLGSLTLPDMPNGTTGIWSSPSSHLSGNIFNITAAGVGIYNFTFTPDDPNSCFLPNMIQVEVVPNAAMTPPVFTNVCENSGPFALGNTVNGVSGMWGNNTNIVSNIFNTNAGAGTYSITFFPDDECTNDLVVNFVVAAATNLTPVIFANVCITSPTINLPSVVQGVNGVWTLSMVVVTSFNPGAQGNGTYSLLFTPQPGQCVNGFTSTIAVGSVFAGDNTNHNVCILLDPIVNLNTFLAPNAGSGGTWKQNNMVITNPTSFDLSGFQIGNFDFEYILTDATCGNDTAIITLNIARAVSAGNGGSLTLCQNNLNNINFSSLLGSFSNGGIWTNSRNININTSNPANVDLSSLPASNTLFSYRFNAGICPGDTAFISVTIDSFFNAGLDKSGDICINSTINLNVLIDMANQGGIFEDINGYGGLTGTVWNSFGRPVNTYTFLYSFPQNNSCPGDSALISIEVKTIITAGSDVVGEYCDGAGFVASDYLPSDASPGGRIMNGAFEVPFGQQILNNLPQYQFLYITGDGATCPFDTAIWTIRRTDRPNINFIVNNLSFCVGDCGDMTIRHNSLESRDIKVRITNNTDIYNNQFILIPNQNIVINFCSKILDPLTFNNLSPSGTNTFTIETISSGQCEFVLNPKPTGNINIKPLVVQNITRTLCFGESLTVGNQLFNAANPSGPALVSSSGNDCDTTFFVNLTFRPEARGNYNNEVCDDNFSYSPFPNQTFNKNKPAGPAFLEGGSFFGCDTIVDVNIKFNTPYVKNRDETTCDQNYSFFVGDTLFNINKRSGQVILKAANGCDSIVNVNLRFLDEVITSIDTTFCDPADKLMVGNIEFNFTRQTGEVEFKNGAANGCDSIVRVNLNFGSLLVGEVISLPACGESTGSITFNNANIPGPFTLFINGQQEDVFPSMPFEKALNAGSYIIDVFSSTGCSTSYNVVIPDNSRPDITIDSINNGFDVYTLTLSGDVNKISGIQWTPASIFSCDTCLTTIASPLSDTEITLEYLFGSDCNETILLTLKKAIAGEFEFPNVIKPGVGQNNHFYIIAPENFNGSILKMDIYDRWGNKVFEQKNLPFNDPSSGWDGNFKGTEVEQGVYVFVIEILDFSDNQTKKYYGDLTVIH
ncbi:MAG: gliding motility-associated C-terminal domain-containing protein [Saprospiraceae bacterium]|nr:gliding motility-associated C-terminal domain-containing protein [Saprospiraceae bacterium]